MLILPVESFADVRSSLAASLDPPSDSKFANLGPTFDKARWNQKTLDVRRFRANVIVGRGSGHAAEALNAWDEEKWRHVEFWGRKEVDVAEGEGEDVEMVSVEGKRTRMVKRGGMICVSRCGRCQVRFGIFLRCAQEADLAGSFRMWIPTMERRIKRCLIRYWQSIDE